MEMDRRAALALGLIGPLLTGGGADAAAPAPAANAVPGDPDAIKIWRVYADAAGESHIERLTARTLHKPLPVVSVQANSYRPVESKWHLAPFKTFMVNLVGTLEAEMSDGTRQRIGPGELVFLEDLVGKGHFTRQMTPVAFLFLRMPDDFDVIAWARDA